MGKINRLDEHLSNMIAAGEVVERPMGIVKELVENSIDAHAKHIEVQILQGGIDTIIIIDDGYGMEASDATLAFERHATSKLKEVNDLWNIHTMGFRGEALPSIASVSHVLLRTNNGTDSTEVEINYGTLKSAKPCGTPKGTMIEVKNLFQKTPARFKHLKSPQYEFSLISDVIQKFALSHPDIGFCLSHDGRTVFKTRGNGNLQEVCMQIYGRDTAKSAIALQGKDLDYEIQGYIMQPQYNRATKYYMLLYINGRMIRNYHLQKAIMDAYSPYMPKERYPIVVVNMVMDAQLVDVNVHPSKWEIRLSKEKQLEKLVYNTICNALKKALEIPAITVTKDNKKEKVEIQELEFTYERDDKIKQLHEEVNDSFKHPEQHPSLNMNELKVKIEEKKLQPQKEIQYPQQPMTHEIRHDIQESSSAYQIQPEKQEVEVLTQNKVHTEAAFKDIPQQSPLEYGKKEETMEAQSHHIDTEYIVNIEEEQNVCEESSNENMKMEQAQPLEPLIEDVNRPINPSLPQLRVIGQLHNCYILAEGEKGLYIIDQHAAQERYHFEVLSNQIMEGKNETQPLLLPITIDSNISAIAQFNELNTLLEQLGIHLEVFGDNTFICREVPMWMKDLKEEDFIRDMIDVWEKDKEIDVNKLRKHAIATMACHSSIRFNRSLTVDEMKQVIDDLGKCVQPFHCPHGRPTLICMEDKALFKEFERG